MYTSLEIENFRCFRHIKIENLARVNLIAGVNNIGKTALLEALFLQAGPNNPELPMMINLFRGSDRTAIEPSELWGWLFFNKDVDQVVRIRRYDETGTRYDLAISLAPPDEPTPSLACTQSDEVSLSSASGSPRELRMEFTDSLGQKTVSRAFVGEEGIPKSERGRLNPLPVGIFLSSRTRFPREDADRYSNLERVGRQDDVVEPLRLLEPRLKRLVIQSRGGVAQLYADVRLSELIPVAYLGEGTARLLQIAVAIANAPGGLVLIDEIENGLHYSVMEKVWSSLAAAAERGRCQIFATTHSRECVSAAHEVFSQRESYDFRLQRLERVSDTIEAVSYDREALEGAIQGRMEVR